MLHKTRGIVLNYIKYRDTSVIVKIYTEVFGLQNYIQNGVRSSNAKTNKMSLLQPLMILDMVVYHKHGQDLHRISEMKPAYVYTTLHTEHRKIAISSFITEILTKCLREETRNEQLFSFIHNSFVTFDHLKNDLFHLQFMLNLSQYLGFYPHSAQEFFEQLTADGLYANTFDSVIYTGFETLLNTTGYEKKVDINPATRSILIDLMVRYFSLHIDKFGELKSLKVLREL